MIKSQDAKLKEQKEELEEQRSQLRNIEAQFIDIKKSNQKYEEQCEKATQNMVQAEQDKKEL